MASIRIERFITPMGFFDRFTSKKSAPADIAPVSAQLPVNGATVGSEHPGQLSAGTPTNESSTPATVPAGGVKARLAAGRERLDAKDLPGAIAIYEELLATSGDRADVLVTVSGDLGSHGHLAQIIEFVAPRYDADRHGPATGLNLLQAYLSVHNAEAAQHVLDILYGLNRPELEDRLHGFSNAVAELLNAPESPQASPGGSSAGGVAKVGLITFSKPIWFYGLEALADQLLPPKEGRLRRIAFAQLAVLGGTTKPNSDSPAADDELARLARALPLWFAETFYFSPLYSPVAAVGIVTPAEGPSRMMSFGAEWTSENLKQLLESTEGGLDYVFTGALRCVAGDYELVLRVWEMKSFRERKAFSIRWTPSTFESALTQLHEQVRAYMEWSPSSAAFAYTVPSQPRGWLETLAASMNLFLVEKNILPREQLPPMDDVLRQSGQRAAASEAAALGYLTLNARAVKLGSTAPTGVTLARSPLVLQAQKILG